MTKEQKLLLLMMKYALQGKKMQALPRGETVDWESLVQESRDHAVPILFLDVISPMEQIIPAEIYKKCFMLARRVTACNLRVEHAQGELVQVLQEEEIPYVILKGETVSADYPVPELRALGDVDFLISQDDTERVAERMQALGYSYSRETGDHHQILKKPGAYLEMHIEVAGVPEGEHRAAVQDFFQNIYEKSRVLHGGCGPFQAPGKAHHGMILVLHMQHHVVDKGIGLRHVMDWGCFVDHTAAEPFWNQELLPMLKKIGLHRFAAVITKMASMYLGTACPAWAANVEEDLCHGLMEDVMTGGNFGRKDKDRARATNMMPNWEKKEKENGKLKLLFNTLRNSVHKQHPELEQKPVATFCHMVGKTGRYIVLYCQGKRPNLMKAAAHADARRSVYERLRMFESEK